MLNILLIVDDAGDILFMKKSLEKMGGSLGRHELTIAPTLKAGLDALSKKKMHVIFLDLSLPGHQEVDTVGQITKAAPDTPLIILTGLDDMSLARDALQKGAQDYLIKGSTTTDRLERAINYAIEREELVKRLEEASDERFQHLIEKNADTMIVVDENGLIRFINFAAETLLKKKREALIGALFDFPLLIGETTEIEILSADDRKTIGEMRVVDIVWDRRPAKLATIRDITDFYEKQRLQVEMKERNRLDELKDEFMSTVSHELRTPLAIIKEGISIVLDGILGPLHEKQAGVLEIAKKNIDRLTRLINDLLDMSKLEAGKVTLKKSFIDMAEIFKELTKSFGSKLEKKGLELKITCPKDTSTIVYADADKIIQVFTNLLGNALKFTEKGFVEIALHKKPDGIEYSVTDTGSGMSKENLDRIFSKFEQFSRTAGPGEKGTGLGLSIAKGLVELHHGKIWVKSKVGKGTSFYFTLPTFEEHKHNLIETIKEGLEKIKKSAIGDYSIVMINLSPIINSGAKEGEIYELHSQILELARASMTRPGDVAEPYNPDKILLLLPETGAKGASQLGEKIKKIATQNFSFSIAAFPQDGGTALELIKNAEKKMKEVNDE